VGLFGVTYGRAAVQQRVRDLIRDGNPPPGTPVSEQIANASEVFREFSSESDLTVKYDLTLNAASVGKLQLGGFVRRTVTDYDAASPFGNEGPFFVEAETNPFAIDERRATVNAGAYAQASRRIATRFGVTAGLRADRYGYLPVVKVSPRVGASVDLTPELSLRLSGGRFYQQPFLAFVTVFPENRSLEPFYADHIVGGVSLTRGRSVRMMLEGYGKRYGRYPVSRDVVQLSLANVGDTFAVRDILFPMISEGTGTAYGIELFAERKPEPGAKWYGQGNLAFSRSRYAGFDAVQRPASYDYPVVANATANYRFNERWEIGTRVSYLAGRPYTPIDEALSSAGRRPIYDLARVNDARSPDYFRLDLRVDRRWLVNGMPLSVYAGAQNITNRKNISGFSWDRRNGGVRQLEQLGIFPIVGLEWQF
jgi:outer membrane receptor protein involved in Fe transport